MLPRTFSIAAAFIAAAMFFFTSTHLNAQTTMPEKIIFDSDMDGDCDDVAALALLHALADRGEAEVLATFACCRSDYTAQCISAINAYYGRPNIPIAGPDSRGIKRLSKYTNAIATRCPHPLPDDAIIPEAPEMYRDILLAQPDQSVTIATVGFHTNLAPLLDLPATADKPSGMDVVRAKVKLWACMGGNFIGQPARDDLSLGNTNFVKDAPAALKAINNWPGKIVFVGREVASVPSGVKVGANFSKLPANHPVRVAYEAYFGGKCKDRHVADPATILFAVRGQRDYWDIESEGYIDLNPDMTFEWKYDQDKNQSFLRKRLIDGKPNDDQIEKVIEELILSDVTRAARP